MPPFVVRDATATQVLEDLGWRDFRKTDDTCMFCKSVGNLIQVAPFRRLAVPMWGAVKEVCERVPGLIYQEFEDAYRARAPEAFDPAKFPM